MSIFKIANHSKGCGRARSFIFIVKCFFWKLAKTGGQGLFIHINPKLSGRDDEFYHIGSSPDPNYKVSGVTCGKPIPLQGRRGNTRVFHCPPLVPAPAWIVHLMFDLNDLLLKVVPISFARICNRFIHTSTYGRVRADDVCLQSPFHPFLTFQYPAKGIKLRIV